MLEFSLGKTNQLFFIFSKTELTKKKKKKNSPNSYQITATTIQITKNAINIRVERIQTKKILLADGFVLELSIAKHKVIYE